MKITSRRQLESWDFACPKGEPGPWKLNKTNVVAALGTSPNAIGVYFMGYCESGHHDDFDLRYVGKAVDQPLHDRLMQHCMGSHNDIIRKHVSAGWKGEPAWFRFVEFTNRGLAELTEGLAITAFLWMGRHTDKRWEGWNRRNEWTQHLAEEDW